MIKVWQDYMATWLDRRIPAARQFALNSRNIFIFPTAFGWLFLLLSFGLFLLGTNYQNNLMLLLCFFLVAVFLVNLFVSFINFSGVRVKLGKTTNVFAGDELHLPLWFDQQSDSKNSAHGLLEVTFWREKQGKHFDLDVFSNPVKIAYPCASRGPLSLPRVTISSFFPMGLFRCWTHLNFDSDILVYPEPLASQINLRSQTFVDVEQGNTASAPGHEDFDSLKSYRTGEPLNHVSWKHLAKGQGMMSKQFSSDSSETGWLYLPPCSADELETRLSQLCFQVLELTREGVLFGLELGPAKIEPGAGLQHQTRCLEALALFNRVKP